MMSHHAMFHNHLDGSTARLSGNNDYQSAGKAQHPHESNAWGISTAA